MDLLRESVLASEGEISVRTYACTYYRSRILGFSTQGYLAVTNKRVIFQALSQLRNGNNLIQSEVPIASVSGINSFKGFYFSIMRLLSLLALIFLISTVIILLFTSISYALQSYTAFMVLGWLLVIAGTAASLLVKRNSVWQIAAASVAFGALLAMSGLDSLLGLASLLGGRSSALGFLSLAMGVYALVLAFRAARRPTFSLVINATGGNNAAIQISSATGIGLLNISANRSLNAEPGPDSSQMLYELGAVIMDIQMLGDYGISKWRQMV